MLENHGSKVLNQVLLKEMFFYHWVISKFLPFQLHTKTFYAFYAELYH